MIKVKSLADLQGAAKPKEPTEIELVNESIKSLAKASHTTLLMIGHMSDSQIQTGKQLEALAKNALTKVQERKQPIRLETSIKRDSSGKMTNIIITPIYS